MKNQKILRLSAFKNNELKNSKFIFGGNNSSSLRPNTDKKLLKGLGVKKPTWGNGNISDKDVSDEDDN